MCRPQKLAFQYLEELASEFSRLYGTQVDSVARPYAFIKFGEPASMTAGCQLEIKLDMWQQPGHDHHRALPRFNAPLQDLLCCGSICWTVRAVVWRRNGLPAAHAAFPDIEPECSVMQSMNEMDASWVFPAPILGELAGSTR